jgi:hypothetical protein
MDLELTPTTTQPEGIAAWTKSITDEYPNFNIAGKSGCRVKQNGLLAKKTVKSGDQNYNSNLPTVMDFYFA